MNSRLGFMTVAMLMLLFNACAQTGFRDPFQSLSRVPHSVSSSYVPVDLPPASPKDERVEETRLSQEGYGHAGDMPPGFKGNILNLSDCIRIALEVNPKTRSTWYAVRSAAVRVGEENAAWLPSVDVSTMAGRQKQITSQNLQSEQAADATNLFDVTFGLNYLLFDGGGRTARINSAIADLQAMGFQHNAVLQQVALKVQLSYYTLLAAGWSKQVAEETVRNTDYHVKLARARFNEGLVPPSDVLKTETELADANLGLVEAKNALRIAEGNLASAMGLTVSVPVEIAEIPESVHPLEAADMKQLLEEASKNRPELLAAMTKIKSKEFGIQESESQYLPKVSANTSYGWIDDSVFPGTDQWSIGINLTFPIFTGYKRNYQTERARMDMEQVRADYVIELRGVELEIWTAFSKLISAEEAIAAGTVFVSSAKESARLADGEYKAGTGNIIALIDAQTALTAARNRLVQARYAWYAARTQFENAVGRSLIDDIGFRVSDSAPNQNKNLPSIPQN